MVVQVLGKYIIMEYLDPQGKKPRARDRVGSVINGGFLNISSQTICNSIKNKGCPQSSSGRVVERGLSRTP